LSTIEEATTISLANGDPAMTVETEPFGPSAVQRCGEVMPTHHSRGVGG
jgi:hypothetical protein